MAPQAATLLPFAATIPVRRELWQRDAECRGVDPELFFPDRGARITEALAACERCTVRAECLDYALRTHQDQGIWGGIPGRKLRRLRHQLEAEAVAS